VVPAEDVRKILSCLMTGYAEERKRQAPVNLKLIVDYEHRISMAW
jgi:hypothetical protein